MAILKYFKRFLEARFCKKFLGSLFFCDEVDKDIHKEPKNKITTKFTAKDRVYDNLFEAKKRLYPQAAKGFFRNLKWILNAIFLTIYLGAPFLRYDRGQGLPNQAILIDFSSGKGYFFGIEMWPDEFYYLMIILILAATILFFITSLFGRIWCGYACFQTVWTDIFIAIEKIFQGDRNARIILDRKNSFEKFYKKTLTHISWLLVSLITGFAFINYFNDAFLQLENILACKVNFTTLLWALGIAGATYVMAGFAREHVCTFMCPYSRFQSAMFDKNTLIIAYDEKRGEPRGKHKQGESFEGRGDCIDCKQCVVVCPAGIDIRNGLQMECIACGLCIDACDEVMEKINRPKGLIRYETQKHLEMPIKANKFKLLSARFFYYTTIICAASSFLLYSLLNKSEIKTSLQHNRNPLFVKLSDGSIRNGYILKIQNKTNEKKEFILKIDNPKQAILRIANRDEAAQNVVLEPNSSANIRFYVIIDKDFLQNNIDNENEIMIKLVLQDFQNSQIEFEEFFIFE